MVDRYNMIGRDFGARMDISPKGDWVRYRDLARLESREVLYKNRVSVAEAGMAALKELANTQMNISLTDWQRISSTIAAALRALKGES